MPSLPKVNYVCVAIVYCLCKGQIAHVRQILQDLFSVRNVNLSHLLPPVQVYGNQSVFAYSLMPRPHLKKEEKCLHEELRLNP